MENNFKHTPGEWSINKSQGRRHWIVSEKEDKIICEMVKNPSVSIDDENEANAKLIATAPDLLEALQKIAECEGLPLDKKDAAGFIQIAKAALTKATSI